MSPSEVIIELYIMPEDASFGAFSFSLKTFFFHYKGGKMSSLSHFETAGLAGGSLALPRCSHQARGPQGQQEGAGRGNPGWRTCHLPLTMAGPCLAGLGPPPLAWPPRLLFLTLDSPS